MICALSMRVVRSAHGELRDAISQDWIAWLGQNGHIGIPVPNRLPDPAACLSKLGAECVILTGGNDLIPRTSAPDETAPERDQTEAAMVTAAMARNCPIFGTCRGLHFLNHYFGGRLNADLKYVTGGTVNHVGATHAVKLTSAFAKLSGRAVIETNSFHDQGVLTSDLASALEAFAVSSADDVVEGTFHPEYPILAVQWHPERPNPEKRFDAQLFDLFLRRGAFWREAG